MDFGNLGTFVWFCNFWRNICRLWLVSLLSTAAMLVISFVCCDRFDFGTTKKAGLWMKYIGTVRAKLLISTVIAKPKSTNLGKNWFLLATPANFGANIRLSICLLLPWKSLNQTAIVWWTLVENYLLVKTRGNCDQETRKQLERESRDIFSASLSITSLVENWYLPSGKDFQGNNMPHLHLTEIINKHCGISSISKMDGTLKWKIQTKHLMPLFGWPRMYAIGAVILDHLGGHSHLRQEIFSLFRIKEYWGNCTLTLKIEVLECNALGVM